MTFSVWARIWIAPAHIATSLLVTSIWTEKTKQYKLEYLRCYQQILYIVDNCHKYTAWHTSCMKASENIDNNRWKATRIHVNNVVALTPLLEIKSKRKGESQSLELSVRIKMMMIVKIERSFQEKSLGIKQL